MQYASPHFNGKTFVNPVTTAVSGKGAMWKILKEYFKTHPNRYPSKPLGPFSVDRPLLDYLPADALRITWLGHATNILEIDGKRFITDPVWYQRASPFTHAGPKRFFDAPLAVADLPPLDAILLSHDHYDHLDKNTVRAITAKGVPVITMLGVGKRLVNWGVDKRLVTELDWWQQKDMGDGFTITACPSRHFSGRGLKDRFTTLWGAFAVKGPKHNVFFGADSGYFDGFKKIGEKLGPFDVTLLDTGAYNEQWPEVHMGPEHAVQATIDLKGKLLLPIHWGTFALAFHPWTEPVERVIKAAKEKGVDLLLPAPGQTCTIASGAYNSGWWQQYL